MLCVTLSGMANRDWQNLARQVKERRDELGLTQPDIDAAGGPSTAVLRRIENAQGARYQPKTIRQLEQALRLRPGSIRAALAGGTFIPVDEEWPVPERRDPLLDSGGLSAEQVEMVRSYIRQLRDNGQDKSA